MITGTCGWSNAALAMAYTTLPHSALREHYMRDGQGFLMVFSINSRDSFELLKEFHQMILRVKDQDTFPVILVGNKCDLEYERRVQQSGMLLACL